MKKINKRKKAIIMLYTYIIMLLSPKTNNNKENNEIIFNTKYSIQDKLFATYNNNFVYIGTEHEINEILSADSNSIYIYDKRNNNNPDIAIYNSYKINNIEDIKIILEILLEYENKYPTNWYRTIKSMENEWLIHNICYKLNIEPNRTSEVDLDNNEEERYQHFIKILIEVLKEHSIEEDNNTNILTKKR